MSRVFATVGLIAASLGAQAVIVTQWNFNSNPPDSSTSTGSYAASVGTGTVSALNCTADFANNGGALGTGSGDTTVADNTALRTYNYPAQGTGSGTGGIQFTISTLGYGSLSLDFGRRHDAGSSRWIRVLADAGSGFSTLADIENPGTENNWIATSVNLSSFSNLNNKAAVTFRIVTIFGNVGSITGATGYATTGNAGSGPGGSSYSVTNTSGKIRYEMLTVSGTAVPEPGTFLALGVGALALLRKRRS
ncbi:MAG: PEP-CTERM sorting domain-containing protein [Chthonomonas sp.]|nr:PEP-CTERM sorting domain-containing protein [Chthonomonas sp.]